jgi:two-component system cell cycle sensor histidine kinase/response regulator CckA
MYDDSRLDSTSPQHMTERLIASELRYRRLFESSKDGILILNAVTGLILDVNPFLVELLGFQREAFLGNKVWELGFFKKIVADQASFEDFQRTPCTRYEDKPLQTADGRQVDVEFVTNVYQVNRQSVIQCTIRDITEHKRDMAALEASQQFIKNIINASPARIFWKSKDLVYLGCNEAFARDAGFSDPKDIEGKTDHQLSWRDQADLYRNDDAQVIISGIPLINREEIQSNPNRSTLTILTSKVPLRDAKGETYGVLGLYIDISEIKQTESSHKLLAEAVDQSAETIMVTDAGASIIYVNPAFEKVTGYAGADVLGKNPRMLKSGKQDADFYRGMWDTLNRGEVWHGHMVNKRKNGTFYEEEATISPVRDTAGNIIHFVAVKRDVTHEAQLENKLRQAQKMEAVGRLAGGIAHDFNNLLMGIMGYTELCLDHVAPDHPNRERLTEIMQAARKSSDITRQLLTFARKQITTPKVINLNDAISGMLKLLRQLIGEDIHLVWTPDSALRTIRIDPAQLDQILANLCLNARDAIGGIGTITLDAHNATLDSAYCSLHPGASPGAYVRLTVSDTGCGMDAETLEHMFEPFFSTKSLGQGTGLGLATVHGIINQNRGFIDVASEPGKGTTFTLYLPQVAAASAECPAPVATQAPKGKGETVLLVEDERSLRVTCGQFLNVLGYKVLLAESPDAALKLAEGHLDHIDLLLTDVVMPGMYGTALAKRLEAIKPGLKILLMSGYAVDAMAQRGIQDHELPFLTKPFSRTELAYKLCEVLDQAEA